MVVNLELDAAKLVEALSHYGIEEMALKAAQPLIGVWGLEGELAVVSIHDGKVCLSVTIEPDEVDDDDYDAFVGDWYEDEDEEEV